MKIISLLVISFLLISCRTTKEIVYETKTRDSIFVEYKTRDTILKFEADSSMIKALIECDSTGEAHLKELITLKSGHRLSVPMLTLKNNILTSSTTIDSMNIYLELKERHQKEFKTKETVRFIETNKLTWWQMLWIKIGKISAIITTIIIIIGLLKLLLLLGEKY